MCERVIAMTTPPTTPPIFIVSGGLGASGTHLVRTALAQFEQAQSTLHIMSEIEQVTQIEPVVRRAAAANGIIVHTLVDVNLRETLVDLAHAYNATAVDLIGPLLMALTRLFEREPLGQPGLYRQLREDYFRRIEAIEFTVDHDDGRKPHELNRAEIVLIGVSRSGKTPLSMYLSTRGWKVANVPLVPEITPPEALFAVDARRVVGLSIEPSQLIDFRQRRQRVLGVGATSIYTNPIAIEHEVEYAGAIFRRGGFAVVDVTNKPIEESADEVIDRVSRRLRA